MPCALCNRSVERLTLHHLIPKEHDGTHDDTVPLCAPCHKQIHVLFDNKHLAHELNTVDKLRAEPAMARFLRWVRKQDPNRKIRARRSRR